MKNKQEKGQFIEGSEAQTNFDLAMRVLFRAPKMKHKPKRRKKKAGKG
jgi:hypothetical protein